MKLINKWWLMCWMKSALILKCILFSSKAWYLVKMDKNYSKESLKMTSIGLEKVSKKTIREYLLTVIICLWMLIVSFLLGIVQDNDGNRMFKGEYRQGILFGKCKKLNN